MGDLIDRKAAIDAIVRKTIYDNVDQIKYECSRNYAKNNDWLGGLKEALEAIEEITSAESNLIHCADCRWWKQDEDIAPYGWCFACRSDTYTEHWNITIRRKYKGDFFCADAEPRIEGEDDDE